ncbi:MAG: mechanosensitive ion channel [Nitrospinaceae bacterium]|jgi:small conductance mechanosensitive channel|nr:MAG: mechanosensitive ion channel [Nitrospinaceae bacterium]
MLQSIDLAKLSTDHLIPWAIQIASALAIFIVGRWASKILVKVLDRGLGKTNLDVMLTHFISSMASTVLLLLVIVAALDQVGVDTTSLIALIGAAGLAVGLALQGSLQNFAAGVLLVFFRPFKAGDFVEAGGTAGVVDKISLFSTLITTGDNREVVVPNGAIYGSNIVNFTARATRRIDMVFGIGYQDDIRLARDLIHKVLNVDERVLKDPAPLVAVGELGASSVDFVVRPWVKTADYWAVKFDVTEKIKQTFDENGVSIPFPQMDVHMQPQSS